MPRPRPVLIFWQEILPGDLRKMIAESANATTGGGARDLRFPNEAFRPIFERMFPEEGHVGGRQVRRGRLVWEDRAKGPRAQVVEYWPPTNARPTEGRLARIHDIEILRDPPDPGDAKLLLILMLEDTGDLRARYTTDLELQAKWHPVISSPILTCLRNKRRRNVAGRGWLNVVNGQDYCHDI